MDRTIKVAVVGVGRFGRHHLRVYHELPGAELVGVFDTDAQRAAEAAKQFQCRKFSSLEELAGGVGGAPTTGPSRIHRPE